MNPTSRKVAAIRARGKPELTQARLAELATYNPETGHFTAAKARGGLRLGDRLGTISTGGYRQIFIDYWSFRAHRLAFLAMEGALPPDNLHVDHIDHQRDNNAWPNLRLLPPEINAAYRSPQHTSASGHRGVYEEPNGKFRAILESKGRVNRLGCFECFDDAVKARCEAERHWFGDAKAKLLQHGGRV